MSDIAERIYEGLVIAGGSALTEIQMEALATEALNAEDAFKKIEQKRLRGQA